MRKYNLKKFVRGWLIGDFSPAILKTKKFEIGIKRYKKGDKENKHYHRKADEITIVVSGKFRMNKKILKSDDIIHISPKVAVDFECLEPGETVVVKVPSAKNDKFICD